MPRALAALFLFALTVQADGQPLGEVARKEKERRVENADKGVAVWEYSSSGEAIVGDFALEETAEPEEASLWDAEREKARELEPRFAEIAREADELDVLFERYRNECHGRYTITRVPGPTAVDPRASYDVRVGRGWLIVLENPNALNVVTPGPGQKTVSDAATPQCQKLRSDVVASAMRVKAAFEEVLEQARRKAILPGMVRELRRKYRLEWGRYRL